MKSYYILRNNAESGPYSFADLKQKKLLNTDLVWIDRESTCWKSPGDIDELQRLAIESQSETLGGTSKKPATHPFSASTPDDTQPESAFKPSFEELRLKYEQKTPRKRVWKRQINVGANLLGVLTLVIGLGVSAFMIKKAVENIEWEPMVATAESKDILQEDLPQSNAQHAAFADTFSMEPKNEESTAMNKTILLSEPLQHELNAIEKKSAPAQISKPTPRVAVKKQKSVDTLLSEEENSLVVTNEFPGKEKTPVTNEEKPISKPELTLSANKYTVGLLGGISNLEISITNPSSLPVSKVVVEIEYQKPNGKIVGTHRVEVASMAAHSTKKIVVPDNGRGVKVQFKVLSMDF